MSITDRSMGSWAPWCWTVRVPDPDCDRRLRRARVSRGFGRGFTRPMGGRLSTLPAVRSYVRVGHRRGDRTSLVRQRADRMAACTRFLKPLPAEGDRAFSSWSDAEPSVTPILAGRAFP